MHAPTLVILFFLLGYRPLAYTGVIEDANSMGEKKTKTEKLFFIFSPCACIARLARFTAKSNHPPLPATRVAQATRPLSRLTIETAKL